MTTKEQRWADLRTKQLGKTIRDTVKTICENRGIKNKDLAEQLGVSRPYVSQILSGAKPLTIKTLAQIEVVLHTHLLTIETYYI